MEEKNRERLRAASTRLIQAVGKDQNKALQVLPYVEAISSSLFQQQIQNHQIFQPTLQYIQQQSQKSQQPDEKLRIAYRLAGFNPKDNPVTQEITRRFGANIKHGELVGIAQAIAEKAQIKLDRDAKRRKNVLLKWFAENWEIISPFLDYIVLEENNDGEEEEDQEQEMNEEQHTPEHNIPMQQTSIQPIVSPTQYQPLISLPQMQATLQVNPIQTHPLSQHMPQQIQQISLPLQSSILDSQRK